ncbi:MAG: NAD-dependent deacylase [Gemmatimonadetes bacterium]|nr:NAD-dependent deacylase [Gemmatimonadota bacterium]
MRSADRILVLTGAGISAESGVPTFREALEGYWSRYRPEDLATPSAFRRDPHKVWTWYHERREMVRDCAPNAAHRALARWTSADPERRVLFTQNVDGLHDRALDELNEAPHRGGTPEAARPRTLHGDLFGVRCSTCAWKTRHLEPLDPSTLETLPHCPDCGALARPAVVWFGENLDPGILDSAFVEAERASVCLVVGTSALVQPAALLPRVVARGGGAVIEVNPDPTPLSAQSAVCLPAPAGSVLPALLD